VELTLPDPVDPRDRFVPGQFQDGEASKSSRRVSFYSVLHAVFARGEAVFIGSYLTI